LSDTDNRTIVQTIAYYNDYESSFLNLYLPDKYHSYILENSSFIIDRPFYFLTINFDFDFVYPPMAVPIMSQSFWYLFELNLTLLGNTLSKMVVENEITKGIIKQIIELIDAEETNKRALGIDENKVYNINDTLIIKIFKILLADLELEAEIEIDELNYGNVALEAARNFQESIKDTFLTYRKEDGNLIITLVTTDLSKKFNDILNRATNIAKQLQGMKNDTYKNPRIIKKKFEYNQDTR